MRGTPEKVFEAKKELQKYSEQDDEDYSDIFEALRSATGDPGMFVVVSIADM